MNREDIIRMARNIASQATHGRNWTYEYAMSVAMQLVEAGAAAEREEFAVHAVDIARRAIAEEREACAKVCEQSAQNYYPAIPEASGACIHLAIAIRTRGQA